MAKNYAIETKNGITKVRFSQAPGANDFRNAINDVADNYQCDLRLWDFGNEGMKITSHELREIARYGKTKFLKPSKVAIIAPKELDYISSQLYEIYRQDTLIEQKVFHTENEALSWLSNSSIE